MASALTDHGLAIARSAEIDLGLGYPQVALPAWLREVLATGVDPDLAYSVPSKLSQAACDGELLEAACRCLRIDQRHAANGFVTFSGSVALDRVLVSQLGGGGSVVTTTPGVDMVTAMLSEHAGVEPVYVPAEAPGFDLDVDALAASLRADTRCIVLSNPDNPSGNVVAAQQLEALVALALEHGVTLVLDQCFALVDPAGIGVPVLADVAPPGLRWVMLWDTGKTFGLNHEKLGFAFCSPEVRSSVGERVNVLQSDVSRRQKLLFRAILDAADANRWFDHLSELVATNLEVVRQACVDLPLVASSPDAGSLVLLDVTPAGLTAPVFADMLLADKGVGVIDASDFFHPLAPSGALQPGHDHFVRVALARDPELVRSAMDKMAELCDELGDRPVVPALS
ncbi:MAG: pyridoxal phosphate-dependent aminotransferase [Actinomycetota bacterium]|nr:pyridoxal phosphate-dependent aminotransferase [Actinomycetota bacterium]